ncbi:MAG TPA: Uma2 family endonuclease [Chitinophagaceae bacterium]|nr:Uma2 family endonuclease [Chitinophagaceae bacterium]
MENEVKEPAPRYNYISPDEYLEMERASTEKHEYYNGYVMAMSGARLKHIQIAANLYTKIGSHLEGKNCQILTADMRVATPDRNAYIYPDATIVCGEPLLEDDKFDTLLNPAVVFEIWSPSTQKNDMGYKLLYYQHIPSLKEYIMIDSAKRFAQAVRKQPDGAWRFEDITGAHDALFINTVSMNLSFDDIYRNTGL